ncbi:MAG: polyribonucleotide nucleotidyltransferase, partial [Deltaproteobacteria bacterium]|nr:polyribonucleotide nucleotidyltransferase [Deltaproteobacteria bacterium]
MEIKTSANSRVVVETTIQDKKISIETGWIAKQADGAVIVRSGDTMVLVTVCTGPARMGQDFFPLTVEYQEKTYAAGKIPGGYFKREARPSEGEILTARLIDRPVRPLFQDDFFDEVQIICTVISADGVNSPDMLAMVGASTALHLSSLPVLSPLAGVRVGRLDGKFVVNPSKEELTRSDIEIVVAGTQDALVMVEGGANVVVESEILDALYFGHGEIKKLIALQEDLRKRVGKEKAVVKTVTRDAALKSKVEQLTSAGVRTALSTVNKAERYEQIKKVKDEVLAPLVAEKPEAAGEINHAFHSIYDQVARQLIVDTKKRIDGRGLTDVRPIECEVGLLPRAHGSALFTRGETQAIVTTTLGTSMDTQTIDSLTERYEKTFMLHYNFP